MCGTVGTEGLEPIRACGCDAMTQHAGTRVVGCWITTCAAVTWEHQGLQKDPLGCSKVCTRSFSVQKEAVEQERLPVASYWLLH